jgi:TP901 family phage tail tape measure protein
MSTSALEKLMFTIGVTDMVSAPAASINKTINGMKQNATSGFDAIRGGAFGLAGAGIAIKTFMQPVYDVEEALGQVRSLGVIESEIKTLTKESLKFSTAYGESAADFIKSSYDIQSAIGGLNNGELATFTNASNILAKGTKADAATITNYMGTMFGIFETQANAMGKAKWVEQLTGQTALAVQMFKTDGAQMSAAFTSIGANATASGVAINEQMAILGTLQATMSGSEAGTKYKAFLAGVAGAQDKLGLTFTDSQGRLLPMLTIMDKLKGKFGSTFDEMEGLELKKAFGSQEAVSLIKLLMGKTKGLGKSMDALGNINGMKNAEVMAKAMVDPWEKFQSVTEAVRISFGTALMPTINDLLETLGGGLQTLTGWTQEFPNITKWVGLLTLGILGMSAATGLFSIILGLGKTAMAAFGMATLALKGSIILLNGVLGAAKVAMVLLNVAMMLNPVAVITLAIVALIAAVGSLFGWWGKLADLFKNIEWGKEILGWLDTLTSKFESLKSLFGFGDVSGEVDVNQNQNIAAVNPINNTQDNGPGLASQIAAAMQGGGVNFGDVTINAEGGLSPEAMEEWGAMQGG